MVDNNSVLMIGEVISDVEFSHCIHGEDFYSLYLGVQRLSESIDKIPIIISGRICKDDSFKKGSFVQLDGQFRSYNNYRGEGSRLILTVFAKNLKVLSKIDESINPNQIFLNGYICKKPIFRKTPFGREIADALLAVNRSYNKSDYIPCITWGGNARFTSQLAVGENVCLFGRIQSREYQKKINLSETIAKTAYEVSISKIEKI